MAADALDAKPVAKADFIREVKRYLKDEELSEQIALGCQQAAKSPYFIHYWAFHSLFLKFNQTGDKKKTLKELLKQAELEKQKERDE